MILPLIPSGIGVGGRQVFGDNFAQLQKLKKKYDPNNVFSKGPQLLFPRANLYWEADQRKLDVVEGSHGLLEFGQMGAVIGVVRRNE